MKNLVVVSLFILILSYQPCLGQIQESFFGLHFSHYEEGQPWPTVPFGMLRTNSEKVRWADLESCPGGPDPNNRCYHWGQNPAGGNLDQVVKMATEHGVEVMFNFYGVPDWASSRGSRCRGLGIPDASCSGPPDESCGGRKNPRNKVTGSCDPPADVDAAPGSGEGDGSDKLFKDFVTAAVAHYGKKVKYWEMWNEALGSPFANPEYWSVRQFAKMTKDLHDVVKSANPDAVVIGANVCHCTPPGSAKFEPWVEGYFSALDKYGPSVVDGISYHGYGIPPEKALDLVADLKQLMDKHPSTRGKSIYNTESAWPGNHRLFRADNDEMPDWDARQAWLARAMISNAAAGAKTFFFFGWDLGRMVGALWAPDKSFGCTIPNRDGKEGFLCPTALVWEQTRTWLLGAVFDKECSTKNQGDGALWTCDITKNNGSYHGRFVWYDADGATTNYTPDKQFTMKRDLDGGSSELKPKAAIQIGNKPALLEEAAKK